MKVSAKIYRMPVYTVSSRPDKTSSSIRPRMCDARCGMQHPWQDEESRVVGDEADIPAPRIGSSILVKGRGCPEWRGS